MLGVGAAAVMVATARDARGSLPRAARPVQERRRRGGPQRFPRVRLLPMAVARDDFFGIMSAFPTGVAIVTTLEPDGTPRGLTTNAVTSVSAEPPILLVCVDRCSRTLPALLHTKRFVVNFMRDDCAELCALFASKADDKFDQVAGPRARRRADPPRVRGRARGARDAGGAGDRRPRRRHRSRRAGRHPSEDVPIVYFQRGYTSAPSAQP